MTRRALAVVGACALLVPVLFAQKSKLQSSQPDNLLNAMMAEMKRAKGLQFARLEAPYYIEYAVDDLDSYSIGASLGGIVSSRHSRMRAPRLQVRVGTYSLDNTNFVLTDFFTGSGPSAVPLDNRILPLRTFFWLATDSAYKAAFEAFARKRAAMANFVSPEPLDDFGKAPGPPDVRILPVVRKPFDESFWTNRVRALSAVFANYPRILNSNVEMESGQSIAYFVNSEGTVTRVPDNLTYLRMRASAQASDGTTINDAALFQTFNADQLPGEPELRQAAVRLAENLTALASAPSGESYIGPVLLEAPAAAQLFAELLGRNLSPVRKPISMPERPVPVLESELEGRMGARLLPDWIDVVDDPTKTEWRGKPLLGHYEVDIEGVVPGPLKIVERGNLVSFLLTRQPVRGYSSSNGRARLLGSFGAKAAAISNLFVTASITTPMPELKKKLIETAQKRNKPYGLLIRKIDFPSAASADELRRISAATAQSGSGRAVSSPLFVYKVFPDGREELVRGLRFKGLNVRSLRDITAASDESHVFDFINNQAPFALIGGSNFVTGSAVVAPAVLFDDLELERPREVKPVLPVVPPPVLTAAKQ